MLERDHPLAGMFDTPRLSPEEVDRAVAVARERYRALAPADFRRMRREDRMGAVRAWIRWILHI
jgi:hypothetical protein